MFLILLSDPSFRALSALAVFFLKMLSFDVIYGVESSLNLTKDFPSIFFELLLDKIDFGVLWSNDSST